MQHGEWIAVAAAWIGTLLILGGSRLWRRRKEPTPEVEAQLQQLSRDYARERAAWREKFDKLGLNHQHQMDAIRATAVEFQLHHPDLDADVRRFVDDVISKTRLRGERG